MREKENKKILPYVPLSDEALAQIVGGVGEDPAAEEEILYFCRFCPASFLNSSDCDDHMMNVHHFNPLFGPSEPVPLPPL